MFLCRFLVTFLKIVDPHKLGFYNTTRYNSVEAYEWSTYRRYIVHDALSNLVHHTSRHKLYEPLAW